MSTRIWTDKKGSSLRLRWNFEGKLIAKNAVAVMTETLSGQTVKTYLFLIHACWDWSKLENPWGDCIGRVKVQSTKQVKPFTIAELQAIIAAFRAHFHFSHYTEFVIFLSHALALSSAMFAPTPTSPTNSPPPDIAPPKSIASNIRLIDISISAKSSAKLAANRSISRHTKLICATSSTPTSKPVNPAKSPLLITCPC
jgi:hypothetical protein